MLKITPSNIKMLQVYNRCYCFIQPPLKTLTKMAHSMLQRFLLVSELRRYYKPDAQLDMRQVSMEVELSRAKILKEADKDRDGRLDLREFLRQV